MKTTQMVGAILGTLLAVAAPSAARADDFKIGVDIYKVGPVTVILRPQPEVEFLCRLSLRATASDRRVLGCYLPGKRVIVTNGDPMVILHEFKHYFEGEWHP